MPPEETGVLLIHGFTGSPLEFTPIETLLKQQGYKAHVVVLPGHGEAPKETLPQSSALAILDHCTSEYEQLASTCQSVVIVGHSLGGICTMLIASIQPEKLAGVVSFCTPYEYAYFYNYFYGLMTLPVSHLLRAIYLAPRDKIQATRPNLKPWELPRLLEQSRVLFSLMKERIPQIRVPVSLAHSRYDLTIPYSEMEKLAEKIRPNAPVKTATLYQSGHRIFPVSPDMNEALAIIQDFLRYDCKVMTLQIPS